MPEEPPLSRGDCLYVPDERLCLGGTELLNHHADYSRILPGVHGNVGWGKTGGKIEAPKRVQCFSCSQKPEKFRQHAGCT